MKWVAPISAFLGYGSWSSFVSYSQDNVVWVYSGLMQGIYAFLSTLFFNALIRHTKLFFEEYSYPHLKTYAVGFIIIFLPFIFHWLAGVAKVLAPTLPGLIMGSIYLVFILEVELRKPKDNS